MHAVKEKKENDVVHFLESIMYRNQCGIAAKSNRLEAEIENRNKKDTRR